MTLPRKINVIIILQLALLAAVLLVSINANLTLTGALLLGGAELYLLFTLYRSVSAPLKKFTRLLKTCLGQSSSTTEMLGRNAEHVVYGPEVNELVTKCLAQINKDNYTLIHDKQAELAALQSQINPHFLYNVLDSIRGQALNDNNSEIANMIKTLEDLFRYSISRKGEMVTLREELANVKNYMTIQRYRFNNRFALEIEIDEEDEIAFDYIIPKLILQPIVENAIYHGLNNKLEGGVITIEVNRTDGSLILMVSDNGEGIDCEKLEQLNTRIQSSDLFYDREEDTTRHSGIALPNINKRIQLLYGDKFGLQVYSTPKLGTDVEILLPVNHERSVSL